MGAGTSNLQASVQYDATQSEWGQTAEDTTGNTTAGYINSTYVVLGNQVGGYSPTGGTCSFYLPAGTLVNGTLFDCGLIPAPSATTQGTAWQCWGTYTVSGTSAPGGFVTVAMNSCGTAHLAAGSAWWVGVATNATGHPNVGFDDCGGAGCSGAAPALGNGTYPYRAIAVPYGTRSSMPSAMSATGTTLQASQYVTVGQPPVLSNTVMLTVTAAPPTLVSVSLYRPGNVNTLTVGGTLTFSATCHYSDSSTTNCAVADIHGNAITVWTTSDATEATIGAVGSANPGLVTAIAAGSLSIGASIGSVTAPAFGLTVTMPAVTLTGLSLATTGGVTGLFVGTSNALVATCLYSDGSATNCTNTDSHGNVAGAYMSTAPAHATVNAASGLVMGVAPGTTMLTATAGSVSSMPIPLTVLTLPSGTYTITISGPVKFSGVVRF